MKIFKNHSSSLVAVATLLMFYPLPLFPSDLLIPDTGQELCYNWTDLIECPNEGEDFYGQDGSYTINPPNLTDNGNGTVADNLTGLVWEQKTEEGEVTSYTFSDAVTYCDNLVLGGYNDWRVPTRKEYSTILNYGRVSPSLDTAYFPFYTSESTNFAYYWTSSEYHDDSSQAWVLRLAFGLIDKFPKTPDSYRVRCVRGTPEPAASYTDNGNGTVFDNLTGLMWEQKTDDSGSRDKDNTYTWRDALEYCENLILGGYSDWRLPTPKEFERVVDLERSNPAIDTVYFPYTNSGLYWTGTSCSGCHKMKAFAVDFTDGELYYGNKYRNEVYYENYVQCVRNAEIGNSSSTTTTVPSSSTTTTSVPAQPCPIETLYGKDAAETQLLRYYRDTLLNSTPQGKEMVRLYYEWGPLLVKVFEENEVLREEIKLLLAEIIALIRP